jgi:hypothetical protein
VGGKVLCDKFMNVKTPNSTTSLVECDYTNYDQCEKKSTVDPKLVVSSECLCGYNPSGKSYCRRTHESK